MVLIIIAHDVCIFSNFPSEIMLFRFHQALTEPFVVNHGDMWHLCPFIIVPNEKIPLNILLCTLIFSMEK
jgi:hypothetical protein